jgi:hypothetical protein
LRALVYTEDANGAPVEASDVKFMSWIYGANANPIQRSGLMYNNEYLFAHGFMPPKGLTVLDFYKSGWYGLKLARDTQSLANLRLETTYTATATGRQRILIDRMVPISRMVG